MDLPKTNYYGVRCLYCDADCFSNSKTKAELLMTKSFKELKYKDFIRTPIGLVLGFGNFPHYCRKKMINE